MPETVVKTENTGTVLPQTPDSVPTASPEGDRNTYINEGFGYTVSYPDHWYPSGVSYANAFELRNFDSQDPQAVAEINRASLIIVDTVNENPEATQNFLDNLIPSEATPGFQEITIAGHRGVRVHKTVPGAPLSPGASTTPGLGAETEQVNYYYAISTYIENGQNLISIEASVPVGADPLVLEEIYQISDSVKFH